MNTKLLIVPLMFFYLYGLTLNLFIPPILRLPTPIVFGLPLVFLFREKGQNEFFYKKELIIFFITSFVFHLLGYERIKVFSVVLITITCCSLYFNYFVGRDLQRLKRSVLIYYCLLALSAFVMLLNHMYPGPVNILRKLLTGETVIQSPSGLTVFVFSFGYQLASLVTFLVIACSTFRKNLIIQIITFAVCLALILFGMNRSVLVVFSFSVAAFWLLYYRAKAVMIFGALIGLVVLFSSDIQELSSGRKQNILSKNERDAKENRDDLMLENLEIIADNPFGLIFYGKTWDDVASRNPAFKRGETGLVTSHNAYMMFLTYVGILPGLMLLFLIHRKIGKIFWAAILHIRKKENALLVSICFSFLAVSMNPFFHNEWLIAGSGPIIFLYFCILQLAKIQDPNKNKSPVTDRHYSSRPLSRSL